MLVSGIPVTLINVSVLVEHLALALHEVVLPVAFILSTVSKTHRPYPSQLTVGKLSNVHVTRGHCQLALTVHLPLSKLTLIPISIFIYHLTLSTTTAPVTSKLVTVWVFENHCATFGLKTAFDPKPIKHSPISVYEPTFA